MTREHHRDRVETNTLFLERAQWLLDRAHLQLILLGDITAACVINRIMRDVEAERQRWLRAVDSPLA
jgi:NADPH-dependent ferric siderophore reductase